MSATHRGLRKSGINGFVNLVRKKFLLTSWIILIILAVSCEPETKIVGIPEVGLYEIDFKVHSATPFYYDNCGTYTMSKWLIIQKKYKVTKISFQMSGNTSNWKYKNIPTKTLNVLQLK